ncbi:protein 5NUC [Ixodes scapularis]
MLEILEPFKEEVRKAGAEYIGISKVELEADNKTCRLKECNMVNLIADSFLAYYADRNSTTPQAWSNVNAAVVNAGITRTSIQQGIIRRRDIMAAMPFESSLVVFTMNGTQLRQMFEHAVSNFTWYNDPEGSFLQVSVSLLGQSTEDFLERRTALLVRPRLAGHSRVSPETLSR